MRHKNDKKLKKALTKKELEVTKANLRAWNYWGRIWRSEEKLIHLLLLWSLLKLEKSFIQKRSVKWPPFLAD